MPSNVHGRLHLHSLAHTACKIARLTGQRDHRQYPCPPVFAYAFRPALTLRCLSREHVLENGKGFGECGPVIEHWARKSVEASRPRESYIRVGGQSCLRREIFPPQPNLPRTLSRFRSPQPRCGDAVTIFLITKTKRDRDLRTVDNTRSPHTEFDVRAFLPIHSLSSTNLIKHPPYGRT